MPAPRVEIECDESDDGWLAHVTVTAPTPTSHVVRVSRAELEQYGGGDVRDLVRRSFGFLLERESNTSVLREFDVSVIERYFPEYAVAMKGR